jgi:hypothetical protein
VAEAPAIRDERDATAAPTTPSLTAGPPGSNRSTLR